VLLEFYGSGEKEYRWNMALKNISMKILSQTAMAIETWG